MHGNGDSLRTWTLNTEIEKIMTQTAGLVHCNERMLEHIYIFVGCRQLKRSKESSAFFSSSNAFSSILKVKCDLVCILCMHR